MKIIVRFALLAVSILLFTAISASALTPQTGQWWNPNESGTGYNIDAQNGVLVITIFTYKTNGDSEWYLASGPMSVNQTQFTGTLDKYRNGQCISCQYQGRPTFIGNDGTIAINFLTESSAILTLPGGRTTTIEPYFPPVTTSNKLDGTYQLARGTVDYLGGSLLDTAAGTLAASGTMVIAGNQLSQTVAITVNGVTIAISFYGTFIDYGPYIIISANGTAKRAPIIIRDGSLVATETINPGVAGSPVYAEVDQWQLVSRSSKAEDGPVPGSDVASSFGGPIGTALGRLAAVPR